MILVSYQKMIRKSYISTASVELAAMIDAPSAVSFSCPQYRNTECSCPIEDEKIDLFLQIEEANP